MRSIAIALALAGHASAFMAPVAKASRQTVLSADYSDEIGAIKPTGFFDPLDLSKDLSPEGFAQYRAAELKHGRVAQLAVIGYIVPEVYRWPGEIAPGIKFADIPHGVAAINAIPTLGWLQIVFLIGAVDFTGFLGDFDSGKPKLSEKDSIIRQTQELQHGRLAMLATLELLRHDSQNLVSPGFDGLDAFITGLPFLYK
jgi:hypothetical protein